MLQCKVVFNIDMNGIIDIAVRGVKLTREPAKEEVKKNGASIHYGYSPGSFTGTEMDDAVHICEHVFDELGAIPEKPAILNLPSTVEGSTPNCYADQIEYFYRNLKGRDRVIINIHPHNDRGCAAAVTELGIMVSAERVEGTIFSNGERTSNTGAVVVAVNMYVQEVDPGLDFVEMDRARKIYESCVKMKVHEWRLYTGELMFAASPDSHQDAVKKGVDYMQKGHLPVRQVPYLPTNPVDVGREYEPIIRTNSQFGKGDAVFIMQQMLGHNLLKEMYPEFGMAIQAACDNLGREPQLQEIFDLLQREYLQTRCLYNLKSYRPYEENESDGETIVHFGGIPRFRYEGHQINGVGNGPASVFLEALGDVRIKDYCSVSYHEHAVSEGADLRVLSHIQLTTPDYKTVFGVRPDNNTSLAPIKGIMCAIDRVQFSTVGNNS